MAEASFLKEHTGSGLVKWRLHTHFEVDRYVPTRIDTTRATGGDADERAVLERTIQSDRLYVMDRGYMAFERLARFEDAGGRSSRATMLLATGWPAPYPQP